jgi:lysophospholipase L1-like esterase
VSTPTDPSRTRRRAIGTLVAATVVGTAALATIGITDRTGFGAEVAADQAPAAAPTSNLDSAGEDTEVRSYVAVGDSITAGMVPGVDSLDSPGPTGWLAGEVSDELVRVGGWAVPGSITADMAAGVVPTAADVLVLLGGTNDLARGIPWSVTEANLRAIATTVGAGTTLAVALPPSDADPIGHTEFNARLAALAGEQGWRFVDPWTSVSAAGSWAAGTTVEGIHPVPAVAATVGRTITDRAWQVADGRGG